MTADRDCFIFQEEKADERIGDVPRQTKRQRVQVVQARTAPPK